MNTCTPKDSWRDLNSREPTFEILVHAAQSLTSETVAATSKAYLQSHSPNTRHCPDTFSSMLYTGHRSSRISMAIPPPTITEAPFTSTRQPQPSDLWQMAHQSSFTWLRGLVPRRFNRNELILWLTVVFTETYAMERFRLKIVILGRLRLM